MHIAVQFSWQFAALLLFVVLFTRLTKFFLRARVHHRQFFLPSADTAQTHNCHLHPYFVRPSPPDRRLPGTREQPTGISNQTSNLYRQHRQLDITGTGNCQHNNLPPFPTPAAVPYRRIRPLSSSALFQISQTYPGTVNPHIILICSHRYQPHCIPELPPLHHSTKSVIMHDILIVIIYLSLSHTNNFPDHIPFFLDAHCSNINQAISRPHTVTHYAIINISRISARIAALRIQKSSPPPPLSSIRVINNNNWQQFKSHHQPFHQPFSRLPPLPASTGFSSADIAGTYAIAIGSRYPSQFFSFALLLLFIPQVQLNHSFIYLHAIIAALNLFTTVSSRRWRQQQHRQGQLASLGPGWATNFRPTAASIATSDSWSRCQQQEQHRRSLPVTTQQQSEQLGQQQA